MRKNKKLILISSILATTAMVIVPTISIVNNTNTVSVTDSQLDNVVQNNEQVGVDSIDNNRDAVDSNSKVKAVDDQFIVGPQALEAAGWGTNIIGNLAFTIIKETDTEKNVNVQPESTDEFTATNFSIQNTITIDGTIYNVTEIVGDGFNGCTGLTSVTVGSGVALIDAQAFSNCVGLTSVTISNGVETIAHGAFGNCPDLTGDLTIPSSVTSIGENAFSYGSHFTSINIDGGNTKYCLAENLGTNCDAVLEKTTGGTFGSDSKIVGGLICGQLELPDSLTSISNNAFANCSGLTGVVIPSSVTAIGDFAFQSCSGLTSVSIGDGVASIGGYAFYGCPLSTIDLTTNINFIRAGNLGNSCEVVLLGDSGGNFSNSSRVVGDLACGEIDFTSSGVTSIDDYAFADCVGITSITFDNKITSIGEESFFGCKGLTSLVIPNSVTSFGMGVFGSCIALTSVVISNGLETISGRAFTDCSGLTSVTIPASVITIDGSAFWNCSNLTTLDLSNATSLETISGDAFWSCSSLTSATIPSSVTSIGDDAFGGCSGLTTLDLTNATSLETIGVNAFNDCSSLTGTLTIPASVTSIGKNAFYNIGSTDFKFLSETAPITLGTNIFGTAVKKVLWVPSITAKANYDLEVAKFGLDSVDYIKITPASIGISLTGVSPFTIDLNQAKETIITTATVTPNPVDATIQEITWSLVDSPNWLVIDTVGNITANEGLKTVLPGPYSFKVEVVCKGAGQTFEKITDAIPINVIYPSITKVTIDPIASANITLGEPANPNLRQCTAEIQPENYDPAKIKWSIISDDKPAWLDINSSTGMISTTQAITTSMPDSKDYTIQLETLDSPVLTATQSFTINFIKPAPTDISIGGVSTSQTVKVNETLTLNPTATIVPDYATTDVAWSLSNGNPLDMNIDPDTGKITFTAAMKHANNTYNFNIIAKSTVVGSSIEGTFAVQLTVNYADVGSVTVADIGAFDLELGEDNTSLATCVATVNPAGTNQAVTWSITQKDDGPAPSWLQISPSGTISVLGATDIALVGAQTYKVKATSQQNTDIDGTNDFTINFTKPEPTGVTIDGLDESYSIKANAALAIQLTSKVNLPYAKDEVEWKINGPVGMTIDSNGKISYTSATPASEVAFTVTCTSKTNPSATTTATSKVTVNYADVASVTVADIGAFDLELGEDNPSLATCVATVNPNPGANQAVKWSIENGPDWISIDSDTGVISVLGATDIALIGTQTITVKATSQQNTDIDGTNDFTINFTKPEPTGVTIDGLDESYSIKANAALVIQLTSKVNLPYAKDEVEWKINGPVGMTIDSSGKISYTSTTPASEVTFTVTCTSKTNPSATTTATSKVTVNYADVASVTVADIGAFNLKLGEDKLDLVKCTATVNPSPGANQTVKWSIENGPDWISIDSDTGIISVIGATDESLLGTQTIRVKATSQQNTGENGIQDFTISFIRPTPPEPKPVPANDLDLGAVIGGTIGGAVGVAAIAGGITYGVKRNKAKK